MKARHKRLGVIFAGIVVIGLAVTLILNAFQNNLVFFHSPSEVHKGQVPIGETFRIGGLVAVGSLQRQAGEQLAFTITDGVHDVTVNYRGSVPDLFREGKGVVADGALTETGVFQAKEILAKHDENYMPPEAALALERAQAQ